MNKYIISTENLNFSYSKSDKDITDLNLLIPKGSIYGFLGPNGSGKTTTIRLLLGLLKKKSGNIAVLNKSFSTNRILNLSKVGALIEAPSLYNHLSANDNLKIALRYRKGIKSERINEVLEVVKLSHVKNKKVKAFSLGMKQRLGLAIALLSNPEILILDEPTNGLDPQGILEMRELIKTLNKDFGTTILISSHLLDEIEKTCTHVGIIQNGKILFQNTVDSLLNSKEASLKVNIETNDSELFVEAIKPIYLNKEIINNTEAVLTLSNKEDIPKLVDKAMKNKVKVYQLKIMNNLEDVFLKLTEN